MYHPAVALYTRYSRIQLLSPINRIVHMPVLNRIDSTKVLQFAYFGQYNEILLFYLRNRKVGTMVYKHPENHPQIHTTPNSSQLFELDTAAKPALTLQRLQFIERLPLLYCSVKYGRESHVYKELEL